MKLPTAEQQTAPVRCDRASAGWSPAPLPANTAIKQHLDRVLFRWQTLVTVMAAVIVLLSLAAHVSARDGLGPDGIAVLLGGVVCTANFWRCRHAHCLVTGGGWLALSALAFVETAVGHSLIGGWEQIVFLAILVLALIFEGSWSLARGTNALSTTCEPIGQRPTRVSGCGRGKLSA